VVAKITGVELSKLLPSSLRSLWQEGDTPDLPEFITERFCAWNFADAKAYDEIFNFPNNMPE